MRGEEGGTTLGGAVERRIGRERRAPTHKAHDHGQDIGTRGELREGDRVEGPGVGPCTPHADSQLVCTRNGACAMGSPAPTRFHAAADRSMWMEPRVRPRAPHTLRGRGMRHNGGVGPIQAQILISRDGTREGFWKNSVKEGGVVEGTGPNKKGMHTRFVDAHASRVRKDTCTGISMRLQGCAGGRADGRASDVDSDHAV